MWADPATPTGKISNAGTVLKTSLEALVKTVKLNKVFHLQVVDAERMMEPLVEGHPFYVEGQPARMSWSRNARAFPFNMIEVRTSLLWKLPGRLCTAPI
jgi:4-hydroxyphenylpyruvate dioxygenase